ncbi:MAG: hypothetical protein HFI87_07215 [Bacilli bacterium]|nr:hypothetical protein [Bacilli bacterium]
MKKLNIKEMKEITYKVISKELEEYHLDVNFFPMTTFEYYTQYVPKSHFNDINSLIQLIKYPFTTMYAYNFLFKNGKNDIIIILDKFKNIDSQLFNLLDTCFHEIRHSIQQKFDSYSYAGFLRKVEMFLRKCYQSNYQIYHNCYSDEIDANMFSSSKTKEFLKKNYPNIYQLEIDIMEENDKKIKINYLLYDASNKICKAIYTARLVKKNLNEISPTFNIFIYDDNNFKLVKDIIENPNFDKLDKRIVYAILSNDFYLSDIDIEKLSDEELKILDESLKYTYNVYINQYNFLYKESKNDIDELSHNDLIDSMEKILFKIEIIKDYLTLLNAAKNPKQYRYEFIKKNLKNNNVEIL